MKYEDFLRFVRIESESDGMGGTIENEVDESVLQCHLVPIKIEIALESYGYKSTKLYKAYCIEKPNLPEDNAILKTGIDTQFKLIQVLPLKRYVLLLEKVN